MGFNKVYLDKEILIKKVSAGKTIRNIFKADAFIFMDSFSSKIYEMYSEKNSEEDIIKIILNEKNNSQ